MYAYINTHGTHKAYFVLIVYNLFTYCLLHMSKPVTYFPVCIPFSFQLIEHLY